MSNPPVIQLKRLFWAGPLTVRASIAGVLVVRILSVLILRPVNPPPSLGWIFPSMFTLVLVTGGVLVFTVVAHFAKNPLRTYHVIAFVFLLISFLPDVGFARSSMPGANWPAAIALMIMHIVAWAITVTLLPRLTIVANR
ncbi:MAG: DUF6069 family protein [Chloroflexi bacterium]|nr:DUF6069 family protein [Chloroflexota bacterium]